MTITLSGITPSGRLTLGNYLGALRRFAIAQDDPRQERIFFVADLHATTADHDPARLRRLTLETAALYLASGLDPARSTIFIQSQVGEHVALAYLLESTAYIGELSRMIQFKEKGGRPKARASLFTYPCLMAADILLYGSDEVPVGGDQDQHVELARTLAIRFNRLYGDTFVVPRPSKAEVVAKIVDLVDPTRKMSKSAPDDAAGVIRMLDSPDLIRRKIARSRTDSGNEVRYDPTTKPGVSNLLDMMAAISGIPQHSLAEEIPSYACLKTRCAEMVIAELSPIQEQFALVMNDGSALMSILARGAADAHDRASRVYAKARRAIGLL